jgi:predicted CXXCH cytochrome family protein
MKRSMLFLMVGCIMWLLAGAAPASADNGPHVKGQGGALPDTCAACHRAHTGQAPYLLKAKQEQLCFTCHGSAAGGSSLDVQEGTAYSSTGRTSAVGALRGGGFKYSLIKSNEVEKEYNASGRLEKAKIPALEAKELKPATSAHSIDESSQMAWGNGEISAVANEGKAIKLTCGSCHDPHGNGMYRILRPIPTESGAKTGVEIADTATKIYTTENYWNSWDPNDLEFEAKISAWCATCHTRLLAGDKENSAKENEMSALTSSGDAVFTYRHRTEYTLEEMKKLGEEHAAGKAKAKPTCAQCHVAHGTDATMGEYSGAVTFPSGKTTESPLEHKEDSFLLRLNNRGVCQTCHNK